MGLLRQRVLSRVRDQLLAPQRPPVRIPRRIPAETPFSKRDAVAYQHASGAWLGLWCADLHRDRGGTFPVFGVLDFVAESPPTARKVRRFPSKAEVAPSVAGLFGRDRRVGVILGGEKDRPRDRTRFLGKVRRKRDARPLSRIVMDWKRLDSWLGASSSLLTLPALPPMLAHSSPQPRCTTPLCPRGLWRLLQERQRIIRHRNRLFKEVGGMPTSISPRRRPRCGPTDASVACSWPSRSA